MAPHPAGGGARARFRQLRERGYAPAVIDLRYDTATKPTAEMLAAMTRAEVGDEQAR